MNRVLALVLVLVLAAGGAAWFLLRGGESQPSHAATLDSAGAEAAQPGEAAAAPSAPLSADPSVGAAGSEERVALAVTPEAPAASAASSSKVATQVKGELRDERGQPIADARVVAISGDDAWLFNELLDADKSNPMFAEFARETRSGPDGRFALELVRPGKLMLAVRARGHAPHDDTQRNAPAGGTLDVGTLTLAAGPYVSGRVLDARGAAVSGAVIRRIPKAESGGLVFFGGFGEQGIALATTGDDGTFVLDILPPGDLELAVKSEAHPNLKHELTGLKPYERRENVLLRLEPGSTIAGVAVGVPENQRGQLVVLASPRRERGADFPMPGEEEESRQAKLAADGTFLVQGLRDGKPYDLSLRRQRGDEPVMFAARLSARVAARSGDRKVELRYLPESSIAFTAIDATTRKPVENFRAEGRMNDRFFEGGFDPGAREQKHPEGKGRVEGLRPRTPNATARLTIRAPGYQDWESENIALSEGEELDLGVIELAQAPVLRVTVLDDSSGKPVQGARVRLRKQQPDNSRMDGVRMGAAISIGGSTGDVEPGEFEFDEPDVHSARTDENGLALVNSFEGASCTLSVEHKAHAPYTSEPFTCAVDAAEDRTVRIGEGGSARVRLVDASGQPVAGGTVEHRAAKGGSPDGLDFFGGGSSREVTDEKGEALFRHLAPGTHRFRPEGGQNGMFGGGGMVFAVAGAPDDGNEWTDAEIVERLEAQVQLVAPHRVTLRGTITEGGQPLADATVSLAKAGGDPQAAMFAGFGGGPEARTDARGRYEIQNVKPGTYNAEVRHASRSMPAVAEVTLGDSGGKLDLDLDVAILEGRVTGSDGKPIANARVSVERDQGGSSSRAVRMVIASDGGESDGVVFGSGPDKQVRTDEDGRFQLRGVRTNTKLVVTASAKGLEDAKSEPLEVAPNEVKRGIDLVLVLAGKLEVSVFSGGEPATEVIVTAYPEGENGGSDKAKRSIPQGGKASFDSLGAGRWVVEARRFTPGLNGTPPTPVQQTVEIVANQTATTRIDL